MPTSVSSKKRKHLEEDVGAAMATKRKRSHQKKTTADVDAVETVENQEHTHILESVTGKLARFPSEDFSESAPDTTEEKSASGEEEGKKADTNLAPKLAAAEYLLLWQHNRTQWAFRKKTQYWLLQNMYEKKQVRWTVLWLRDSR